MKALAINGSPRMGNGNTAMILGPFLDGMRDEGTDVELFYTKLLKIEPCSGDMSCWFVNPGICGQKDDMQMLLPKIQEADILVWASPVYYAGLSGPLKNLMDRQLPIHMMGELGGKRKKIVLVSSCSAWEISMFDPLLSQMSAIYSRPDGNTDFAGALLRPMAEGIREMIKAGETKSLEAVFEAAREAGRQLVRDGRISTALQERVSKELMPRDAYYKVAMEMMQQAKDKMRDKK